MNRRKLVYYLLLNVFISATVTGGILFWYDRNYRAVTQSSVQQVAPVSGGSDPASTLSPQTDIAVKISSVVGGSLNGGSDILFDWDLLLLYPLLLELSRLKLRNLMDVVADTDDE